jgi:hypothetical protein
VRATWTLGPQLGEQALTGIVRGSDVEAKLVLQAVPRAAAAAIQAGTPKPGTKPGVTKPGATKAPPAKPATSKTAPPRPAVAKPAPPKKRPSRSG